MIGPHLRLAVRVVGTGPWGLAIRPVIRTSAHGPGGQPPGVRRQTSKALREAITANIIKVARAIEFTDPAPEPPAEPSSAAYRELQLKIGYTFKSVYLLRLSLIQPCAAQNTNNRLLAWIGDAALQLVLTERALAAADLASAQVGALTQNRAGAASRAAFLTLAQKINLAAFLIASKNTRETHGASNNMLAETFEAVMGAVYVEGGLGAVGDAYDHVVESTDVSGD